MSSSSFCPLTRPSSPTHLLKKKKKKKDGQPPNKENPLFVKFFGMLSSKVPLPQIVSLMRTNGVDPRHPQVRLFLFKKKKKGDPDGKAVAGASSSSSRGQDDDDDDDDEEEKVPSPPAAQQEEGRRKGRRVGRITLFSFSFIWRLAFPFPFFFSFIFVTCVLVCLWRRFFLVCVGLVHQHFQKKKKKKEPHKQPIVSGHQRRCDQHPLRVSRSQHKEKGLVHRFSMKTTTEKGKERTRENQGEGEREGKEERYSMTCR
jgi:hypothetical protein